MGKAIDTCRDNLGYFNPPNVYRPAIIDIRIVGEYSAEDGATNTYRITQNDGKIFEFDVKNGSGGSAGRSVTSVEQIQISTESLGKNVARISLSDGTYTDVEIRNGAQGQPGPQGERGPAGIDQVEATVDNQVGTPSVDTSVVEGKLHLDFHNMKGVQGEPAVGIENYVIVEATPSTTAATDVLPPTGSPDTLYRVACWDGTQYDATVYSVYGWYNGAYKFLEKKEVGIDDEPTANSQNLVKSGGVAAKINQLGQELVVLPSGANCSIFNWQRGAFDNSTGEIRSNYLYRVVEDVIVYASAPVHITANDGFQINVYLYNADGTGIGYIGSWATDMTVPQGSYFRVTIRKNPEDTSITADVSEFVGNINIGRIDDIEKRLSSAGTHIKDLYLDTELLSAETFDGYITGGAWKLVDTNNRTYKLIKVPGISGTLHIVGSSAGEASIAFLSSYQPINGSSVGIISVTGVSANATKDVVIPNGTNYIYVLYMSGNNRLPAEMKIGTEMRTGTINLISDTIKTALFNTANRINAESIDTKLLSEKSFDGYIKSGAWEFVSTGNRTYKIIYTPKISGTLRVVGSSVGESVIGFLSSYVPVQGSSVGILSTNNVSAGATKDMVIPDGTNYLYILHISGTNRLPQKIGYGIGYANLMSDTVRELIFETANESSNILSLNPTNEVVPKLENLKRAYRAYGYAPTKQTLALLHFSDIHNSGTNMARLKDFLSVYGNQLDDVISTGDTLGYDLNDTLNAEWDGSWLNTIGNHDAVINSGGSWVIQPSIDSYNKLFAPFISGWGVTQPADAAINGYCYYYKDYTSKGFRLIVIDNYKQGDSANNHWNATQKAWFEATLESARLADLQVIVAVHYMPFAPIHENSNPFDSIDYVGDGLVGDPEIPECVDTFINNGGTFVCWLCGHTHFNKFGINTSYPGQVVIVVPCASTSAAQNYSDEERVVGAKTEDCFDILAFDSVSKTIKMMRIGSNYDRYMRRKNTISWDYNNHQLIYVDC